jgi:hypothetical protein
MLPFSSKSKNHRVRSCLLTVGMCAVTAMGCADDTQEDALPASSPRALQAPAGQTVLLNPAGVYFAEVIANGTGCPAGTWTTSLAPDGQTFTTTFSAYEAEVHPSSAISIKDCMLSIKLHSPQGLSYSVSSFYYSGYAYLERGVSGRQFASYYFQGNPAESAQLRTDLVGPYDDTFLFSDEVQIVDMVWSPCGLVRDLNVMTRLRVRNGSPRASGYMNVAAVDASIKLVFKLAWRTCDADAGRPDAGADAGRDSGIARMPSQTL